MTIITKEEVQKWIEFLYKDLCKDNVFIGGYYFNFQQQKELEKIKSKLDKQIDRYTVRITDNAESYLHASSCDNYNCFLFKQLGELPSWWVYKFTKQEIESFKKRDDLAIDWNKAIIEKVKD